MTSSWGQSSASSSRVSAACAWAIRANSWFTEQAALAGADRLFVAVPMFLAGGTRAD
jgi:hypothetical protein